MRSRLGDLRVAAVRQEVGTVHVRARPFLGPAAGETGEEVARVVRAVGAAGMRGEELGGGTGDGGDGDGEPDIMQVSATETDAGR